MARNRQFMYKQETQTVPSNDVSGRNDTEAFVEPTQEAIRERAYQIFLARGAGPGSETDDWSQAEKELKRAATRAQKR